MIAIILVNLSLNLFMSGTSIDCTLSWVKTDWSVTVAYVTMNLPLHGTYTHLVWQRKPRHKPQMLFAFT